MFVGLPLCFAERQIPHVFREYNVALLDVFYHLPIRIGIGPSAPDGTGEINFLHMGKGKKFFWKEFRIFAKKTETL